ncbi:hypothetical protein QVN76_07250 [Yersinia rochesterensis]|uniref:hypothetical protein n=1 Tax=Yersinia rochesterensis TaxID=1604335 RepID=UPI0025AB5311|nr:hypothetical protein [Yersinia rochesterensis]MDN0106687.1 hypothetical protein [Yersinia rochesterensis]
MNKLTKQELQEMTVVYGNSHNVCRAARELLSLREQLEAERQRADTFQTERDEFRRRLKLERSILEDTEKQLAELKALPPVGQIVLSDYDSDGTRTARVACLHKQADWDNFQDGTLLFTAAKPAEIPLHVFSMLVNELRDVPAIGCKRELIVGALNRYGVIAEPVGD